MPERPEYANMSVNANADEYARTFLGEAPMRVSNILKVSAAVVSAMILAGCQSSGTPYQADTYSVNQLNRAQNVRQIEIIAINPARVRVPNANEDDARLAGTLLGAAAGVVIGNQDHQRGSSRLIGGLAGGAVGNMLAKSIAGGGMDTVEGVQLMYVGPDGRTMQSTQVGRYCEFRTGPALLVSPAPGQTRIQPNNPYGCGPMPR